MIFTKYLGVLKPIATLRAWQYDFDTSTSSQLPRSPRMPSWRRMTSEDVPSAFALINKWSSQFDIGQVFDSEELAYNLLCSIPVHLYGGNELDNINNLNNITDLVSFNLINKMDMVFSISK